MIFNQFKFDFYLRKLHSLTGIFPLGLFLFEHLLVNSTALYGETAFNQAVKYLHSIPFLWALELFLIALPLSCHALLGIIIALQAVNSPVKYRYMRNWMFYLQRISGLIMFSFLIYHLLNLKFNPRLAGLAMYEKVVAQFSSPGGIIIYALGLACALFHFTNGLWGFAVNWGIITGPRAQKIFGSFTIALFLIASFFGFRIMFAFINQ
ncbi:MAG: succinate dehydrogenase [Peptococcaceae bacterium]|jgi:succinate dehydrogenase / fumarate reductase cytochrome b subunit|nr:succinate dehydrogenase [Peptococcaceae bacterium]MDH7526099.1 succinate dehydrogenase [Peptococcaceae bacterium]